MQHYFDIWGESCENDDIPYINIHTKFYQVSMDGLGETNKKS